MLIAIAQTLHAEGLVDADFMKRYTHGYEEFIPYLKANHDFPELVTHAYDPVEPGQIAHTCMVGIERFEGELPVVTAFDPPVIYQS